MEIGAMPESVVNLYVAKTPPSSLVERAARGEAIVIAKAGRPLARPVSPAAKGDRRLAPYGVSMLGT